MTFRRFNKQHRLAIKSLRVKQHIDPVKLNFYTSNRPQENDTQVSTVLNAFKLSDRQRFTLKKSGKLFNYQGVLTKRYDVPTILKLFFISRATLYLWIDKGIFPEPYIRIIGKKSKIYWFYHQIQPVYTWYHSLRARGIERISDSTDLSVLRRLLKAQDQRWHKLIGVEYIDPYRATAGKYGVLWES